MAEQVQYTNRLAQEKSTYLLQHAHNPVDWYPWGDEAIQKAKAESKLIFLSVGYSTCHWCHVMEKESFENPTVAKLMNELYVNIKVDREERPDIDRIYMNFVVMINGSGGWPMSVWLTPDLAPISAGTYYPPVDRWGTLGFTTVLNKIHEKWQADPANLRRVGLKVIDVMRSHLSETSAVGSTDTGGAEAALLSVESKFNEAVRIFDRNMDSEWGGFGGAPKFPEASKLQFMLHAHVHAQPKPSTMLALVLQTLRRIDQGGIHDHVFGGFSRYAVDRKWHIPHFEKMLYDQAQLMQLYANAFKLTGDTKWANVADDIYRYVCQDLRHPDGGFYSGEDADSYPEHGDADKVEGAFYAWEWQELRDLFDEHQSRFSFAKSADLFCHYYGVKEGGNVEPANDPQGHLLNKNILMVQKSVDETAAHFRTTAAVVQQVLSDFNGILHVVRDKRPRPHLDTKILCAWNGLMLSGLAKLASVSTEKSAEYTRTASELVAFLKAHLYDANEKTLWRSCYGEGTGSRAATVSDNPISGFLDDYAFLIRGLLDLYIVTMDVGLLEWARELQATQDRLFWDDEHHAYFYSQANAANVVIRLKDDHDGAEPCGNSISSTNLILLAKYFEDDSFTAKVEQQFGFYARSSPFGYTLPEMMSGLLLNDCGTALLVVAGRSGEKSTEDLLKIARSFYVPGLVLAHVSEDPSTSTTLRNVGGYPMVNGKATAYLCHNNVCELPVTDAEKLKERLSKAYRFIVEN